MPLSMGAPDADLGAVNFRKAERPRKGRLLKDAGTGYDPFTTARVRKDAGHDKQDRALDQTDEPPADPS